jgi:hypothetical protein
MNKKKNIFIALFVVVILTYIMLNGRREAIEPEISDEETAINLSLPNKKTSKTTSATEFPYSYYSCKKFRGEHSKLFLKWVDGIGKNAERLINEGYTVEDIAYAIEHFRGTNSARDWVFGYLTKKVKISQTNAVEEANHLNQYRENKKRILKILAERESMSAEEFISAINVEAITVNDLVSYVGWKPKNEQLIIELLDHVEDLNQMITSPSLTRYEPIHLLEFSISRKLYGVTLSLLDAGVKPKQGIYLSNAMELALNNLYVEIYSKDISNHIPVIKKLSSVGLTARHHVADGGEIKAWMELSPYSFNSYWVTKLQQEFELDLISLGRPIELSETRFNTTLISRLEREKQEFLAKEFSNVGYEETGSRCDELLNNISTEWSQPNIYSDENSKLFERFTKDPFLVEQEIVLKDPDYVDCFRNLARKSNSRKLDQSDFAKAFFAERRKKEFSITNFVQENNPHEDELTWLYNTNFSLNSTKNIKALFESGFFPSQLDYSYFNYNKLNFSQIRELEIFGINLKEKDRLGKSLIYYAVKNQKTELVEQLVDEGYLLAFDSVSQDALHILLASWKRRFSVDNMLKMLPHIMSTKPKIDRFHLARVKLLQLRDIALYKRITSEYPSLVVTENTEYPDAACY